MPRLPGLLPNKMQQDHMDTNLARIVLIFDCGFCSSTASLEVVEPGVACKSGNLEGCHSCFDENLRVKMIEQGEASCRRCSIVVRVWRA